MKLKKFIKKFISKKTEVVLWYEVNGNGYDRIIMGKSKSQKLEPYYNNPVLLIMDIPCADDWREIVNIVIDEDVMDKNGFRIKDGDFLDVQGVGVHKVYKHRSHLWFEPYGHPEKVSAYFRKDIEKV